MREKDTLQCSVTEKPYGGKIMEWKKTRIYLLLQISLD